MCFPGCLFLDVECHQCVPLPKRVTDLSRDESGPFGLLFVDLKSVFMSELALFYYAFVKAMKFWYTPLYKVKYLKAYLSLSTIFTIRHTSPMK